MRKQRKDTGNCREKQKTYQLMTSCWCWGRQDPPRVAHEIHFRGAHRCSGRSYWIENTGLPQLHPVLRLLQEQVAQLHLAEEDAQPRGHGPARAPTKPRRSKTQRCPAIGRASRLQPSSSLGSCPDAIGAAVRPSRLRRSTPGALSASITFPPLGREQAFFQTIQSLSWLFLGCAGASPYQPLSWVFQGCLPFS